MSAVSAPPHQGIDLGQGTPEEFERGRLALDAWQRAHPGEPLPQPGEVWTLSVSPDPETSGAFSPSVLILYRCPNHPAWVVCDHLGVKQRLWDVSLRRHRLQDMEGGSWRKKHPGFVTVATRERLMRTARWVAA